MEKPSKIIDFSRIIDPVNDDIHAIEKEVTQIETDRKEDHQEIASLQQRIQALALDMNVPAEVFSLPNEELELINDQINGQLLRHSEFKNEKFSRFPRLSAQDTLVCIVAGVLSVLIDVIFVGTPEVAKKGGENFDGSILTGVLRKLGKDKDDKLSTVFQWFSDKCKVPYDISLKSGTVTPNNHRLRSLAHDPFWGLLFAVADIILGTTTCIDNNGKLTVIANANRAPAVEKWLAVIYYLGHIISDIYTSRGIPIPGFFCTQFFSNETGDSSVSAIAEEMYKDGYDLRHMVSMSVPVFVKDMLIKVYLELNRKNPAVIMTISEREKFELDFKLKTYKMKFVADCVATTGNAVKFVAPPNLGNPCALNLVQWMAFIKNGITMLTASVRDTSAEETVYNRQRIDEKWKGLMSDNIERD